MDAFRTYAGTRGAVKAGLTGISGAATTYSTGATTLQYSIAGKAYSKAQVSGGASPTTDANDGSAITLTAGKARAVVWGFDASGNVKAVAGPIVDWDGTAFKQAPLFPAIPDSICPFAYTIHKAGSTTVGTWTFGSSNWNATGLSHAVVDVLEMPSRPQTS